MWGFSRFPLGQPCPNPTRLHHKSLKISYDSTKNERNIRERGLPFDLILEMDWARAVIIEDTRKDYEERRFRVFSYIGDRLFAAVFTSMP